jgi:hypothetical protein
MLIEHPVTARRRSVHRAVIGASLLLAASSAPAHAATAYALTSTNQILVFDTSIPTTITTTLSISGLQTGESVLGLDVRPATGQLYALGSTSRLYVIDTTTGTARQIGSAAFGTALSGSSFGVDFNPTVDRIRVVSDNEQSLRLNPDSGAVAGTDTNLATAGDIVGSAYTNNFSGATVTTLYGIDAVNDQLVLQGGLNGTPSPNGGAITVVGALGVDTSTAVGFDITGSDGVAYAALTVAGASNLYRLNLATGAATLIGTIGTGAEIRGLAVASRAVTLYGVTTLNQLVRFHSATPGIIRTTGAITGLQTGENVVGIDFRPATGELYALGSTSRVYRLNTATAAATQIGTTPFAPALSGTEFGFDFNPTVDRIRVVSNASQNFRINPNTGAAVAPGDTPLTHLGAPDTAVGVAYTNSVDGATSTTLYTLDADNDRIGMQGSPGGSPVSPNAGIVTDVGALGVDTSDLAGFDIAAGDGTAFAALTVSGIPALYTIDLQTGAATLIGAINTGTPLRALAAQPTNYNLAEGATGTFFDTDLVIFNPNTTATPATVTYLRQDGQSFTQGVSLGASSLTTVLTDSTPGLEFTAFSSVVSSPLGLPLVVERTMRWDPTGYGAHTDKASEALGRTWYFAEGSQGFFQTFLLLSNPSDSANNARVEFLIEGGSPVVKNYPMTPRSRFTIYAGEIPEVVNQSFGMTVTFDRAAAAERAMYFGTPTFNGGHESAGAPSPSTNWFLAEGATGDYFSTFLLLANPGDTPANVTLTFFKEGGAPIMRTKTVAPRARLTLNIATEDPSLVATAVATQVSSDVGVVAERAQYWPGPLSQWHEAHNSFGVTTTALRWALAEGRTGGPLQYQTYFLVANPGSIAANVTLTFVRTAGAPVTKTVSVPGNSRYTVTTGPGSFVPELANESFSTVVTSDRPIFAERAMYSNDTNGVIWAAGTNATATAVP